MRPFDFYAPTTVVEALTLLDQYKDSVACIAGGTDLTLELNEWKAQPAVVIDLKKLKELDYIKVEDGIVRIGALTTHAEVAANDIIRENVHILYDACRQVGSPQIRNLATLGGNITPVGASANIAAIGILRKEGYEVKNRDFLRVGLPFTLVAVLVGYAYIWLVWA